MRVRKKKKDIKIKNIEYINMNMSIVIEKKTTKKKKKKKKKKKREKYITFLKIFEEGFGVFELFCVNSRITFVGHSKI